MTEAERMAHLERLARGNYVPPDHPVTMDDYWAQRPEQRKAFDAELNRLFRNTPYTRRAYGQREPMPWRDVAMVFAAILVPWLVIWWGLSKVLSHWLP